MSVDADVALHVDEAMVKVQAVPSWFTVNAWAAMVTTPLRATLVSFEATVYNTVPLPVPFVPEVMAIQLLVLFTVHTQSVAVTTPTDPVSRPAPWVRLAEVMA